MLRNLKGHHMDDPSKHIDEQAVREQGTPPQDKHDPGAIPSPHSLPVSDEFERVIDQQEDETGSVQDIDENVSGQAPESGDDQD